MSVESETARTGPNDRAVGQPGRVREDQPLAE